MDKKKKKKKKKKIEYTKVRVFERRKEFYKKCKSLYGLISDVIYQKENNEVTPKNI
jgi:hypothetical protein